MEIDIKQHNKRQKSMESIREQPQYKTLELNQYETQKKILKTNGSEYSCETRPITQTSETLFLPN